MHIWMDRASELQLDYVAAQRCLMDRIDSARRGEQHWPRPEDYEAVAQLGKLASIHVLRYLEDLKETRCRSRIDRIQRMSAEERGWQPTPEAWLWQQDQKMSAGSAIGA